MEDSSGAETLLQEVDICTPNNQCIGLADVVKTVFCGQIRFLKAEYAIAYRTWGKSHPSINGGLSVIRQLFQDSSFAIP